MAVIGGNLAFGIQWRHFTTSRDSNVDVTSTTSFFLKIIQKIRIVVMFLLDLSKNAQYINFNTTTNKSTIRSLS